MRKVTQETVQSFLNQQPTTKGNVFVSGKEYYLHNNKIMEHRSDGIYISNAGFETLTTKERLNGLGSITGKFQIFQKNFQWFIQFTNQKPKQWNGKWIKI